jgi:two-component system cell cycle sensor histidine kinase/response regulator CckA
MVEIESMPFPSARVDEAGCIVAANAAWLAAHPGLGVGKGCWDWCVGPGESHEFREALHAGIDGIVSGAQQLYVKAFAGRAGLHSVTVSRAAGGALIISQDLGCYSTEPSASASAGSLNLQTQKLETMGRLVGGVAHDFANLLTLIDGYSDMLLNRIGESDPVRPELEEIRKAASRGARLTSQLMGYTRSQPSERCALDLNALIAGIERMLRPIIGENVVLETGLRQDLGKVMADPGHVEQVVMNLILNARDAMPGGGLIRIETAEREFGALEARQHGVEPGDYILLSIADTGHGITREAIAHVFEPFFTTKAAGEGTGIGLSTVDRIVKQCGGDVWVRSAPGEGATFTICLPRTSEGQEAQEGRAPVPQSAGGDETVLLVEDEASVRKLLSHVLRKRGYRVLEASRGEQAFEIFEREGSRINLVLTDMVMPGMSGRELAGCIRRIAPATRVVLMSGYTNDVLVPTDAPEPGITFLQKPLRPDALAAGVRKALDSPFQPFNPL